MEGVKIDCIQEKNEPVISNYQMTIPYLRVASEGLQGEAVQDSEEETGPRQVISRGSGQREAGRTCEAGGTAVSPLPAIPPHPAALLTRWPCSSRAGSHPWSRMPAQLRPPFTRGPAKAAQDKSRD